MDYLGIGQSNALARRRNGELEMHVINVSYLFPPRPTNYANHFWQAAPMVTGRLNAPGSNGDGDQYSTKYLRAHTD